MNMKIGKMNMALSRYYINPGNKIPSLNMFAGSATGCNKDGKATFVLLDITHGEKVVVYVYEVTGSQDLKVDKREWRKK